MAKVIYRRRRGMSQNTKLVLGIGGGIAVILAVAYWKKWPPLMKFVHGPAHPAAQGKPPMGHPGMMPPGGGHPGMPGGAPPGMGFQGGPMMGGGGGGGMNPMLMSMMMNAMQPQQQPPIVVQNTPSPYGYPGYGYGFGQSYPYSMGMPGMSPYIGMPGMMPAVSPMLTTPMAPVMPAGVI